MRNSRNRHVEDAVNSILESIDDFIGNETLSSLPKAMNRRYADEQLEHRSNSVRLASLFLSQYSIQDNLWDCNSVPTGIRGAWGDKKLASELNKRQITLHNSITAFGENLGWKGNVADVRLYNDPRFANFVKSLSQSSTQERTNIVEYMCSRFAESRRVISPLPAVGDEILTFQRSKILFQRLLNSKSEGNIQQFMVAALLLVHRKRYGFEIKTHHVHASDKYDNRAGDIEEFYEGTLVRAFEVTVRPDWKNRITDFRKKMDAAGLSKYVILASGINSDPDLAEPASMLSFMEPFGRDIAVVELSDFLNVFCAELSASELREAIYQTYSFLVNPKYCGRADILDIYKNIVEGWLEKLS